LAIPTTSAGVGAGAVVTTADTAAVGVAAGTVVEAVGAEAEAMAVAVATTNILHRKTLRAAENFGRPNHLRECALAS